MYVERKKQLVVKATRSNFIEKGNYDRDEYFNNSGRPLSCTSMRMLTMSSIEEPKVSSPRVDTKRSCIGKPKVQHVGEPRKGRQEDKHVPT